MRLSRASHCPRTSVSSGQSQTHISRDDRGLLLSRRNKDAVEHGVIVEPASSSGSANANRSTVMSHVNQHVGLDVSLKETSICVLDEAGKIEWRGSVASTPNDLVTALRKHASHAERIGLEAGQLSSWLYREMKPAGLPVICIDARHAHATLSLKTNKTDSNDALGLAQIMRVGQKPRLPDLAHPAGRPRAARRRRHRTEELRAWCVESLWPRFAAWFAYAIRPSRPTNHRRQPCTRCHRRADAEGPGNHARVVEDL